jgi:hypothetical protein
MIYTGISLGDFLKQFTTSQQKFDELTKQYEALRQQLSDPQFMQNLQKRQFQQQATMPSQPLKVIKQSFPDFHSGTQEVVINPLTGEIFVPPKVFPSLSEQRTSTVKTVSAQPKSTKSSTEKKPLTAKTIEQIADVQSSIPILPYTPEGVLHFLSQGKITLPQAQQILKNMAQNDLSVGNIYDEIYKAIQNLPENAKKALDKMENTLKEIHSHLEDNLNKQIEIQQRYTDKQVELLNKQLTLIEQIFTDLMKEKPNLEPDKWTEFGRRLAMALGAISALVHPQYAPYFYMAIPQIVQYWYNEDMQNFEKAMRKFELALQLAGTQLDFYNQIFERNLAILEKLKEKELLPLIVSEKLLMEKYYTFSEAYAKMAGEVAKAFSDEIGHLLKLQELKLKEKHNENIAKLRELTQQIALIRLKLYEQFTKQKLAISNYMAKLAGQKFALTVDLLTNPQKYLGKFIPNLLQKTQSLPEALNLLRLLNFPVENVLEQVLQWKALTNELIF